MARVRREAGRAGVTQELSSATYSVEGQPELHETRWGLQKCTTNLTNEVTYETHTHTQFVYGEDVEDRVSYSSGWSQTPMMVCFDQHSDRI